MVVGVAAMDSNEYSVVETKRRKPCLLFRGYRYVQDKIQNRTIYWRCEDRAHCNGRAHQLVGIDSIPILTIKHNHQPADDDRLNVHTIDGRYRHKQRRNRKLFYRHDDDDPLSSSAMTSPIKLENQQNKHHHHHHQHGAMVKNLHLSEVITTAAAVSGHHHNGVGGVLRSGLLVDPIEMTKLLSNITTATTAHFESKHVSSTTMDSPSRLNHFSWEELEGRYVPVLFRNENGSLQRYTSKMYVESTLFQSESWQRHAILARSLPPLISFTYSELELKLFRSIVEWHLASFNLKSIPPSDCLIRFEDLLDFHGALRKLRDTMPTSFSRPLPPPVPMPPPSARQHRVPPTNGLGHSFELPTMGTSLKHSHPHQQQQQQQHPSSKMFAPSPHTNYLLHQNADLLASFPSPLQTPTPPSASQPQMSPYNFTSIAPKLPQSTVPVMPPTQWAEGLNKGNDKARHVQRQMMVPHQQQQEQMIHDKRPSSCSSIPKHHQAHHHSIDNPGVLSVPSTRETKESGWVQINNVFVPYIVKLKLRDSDLDNRPVKQPPPQLQREFYVPYEILIKCHIFSDNEFSFKKFLIKATPQDFEIFNTLISNINIFDEKVPEKTLLVNLYHTMIGLNRILYVKLLNTKQPRTQVNKYHADVLIHKGGAMIINGTKLVPYIVQNNRFYVPLVYAYHSQPNVLAQARRGARAPRQYEIDYLNLLFLYFSIDAPPLTSDTLLVDAYNVKCENDRTPVHYRTLSEHQQYERNRLLNTLLRLTQVNNKTTNKSNAQQQMSATKITAATAVPASSSSSYKSNKCPSGSVVVNPLIHHPSFYGLPTSSSPIKQPPPPPPPPPPPAPLPVPPSTSSNSVVLNPAVNPFLLSQSSTHPPRPTTIPSETLKKSIKSAQMKSLLIDNRRLRAIVKSPNLPLADWKISIKQILEQFSLTIDYNQFIQWCKKHLRLPFVRLDEDEKKLMGEIIEEYYIYHRDLERCLTLMNDIKRGTIVITNSQVQLPPPPPPPPATAKLQFAGAKKRKTTVPTTRHVIPSTGPTISCSAMSESELSSIPISASRGPGYLSPELPLREATPPIPLLTPNHDVVCSSPTSLTSTVDQLTRATLDEDDRMPVVATVEEEQQIQETIPSEMETSFLIVESSVCDDERIHLDDTLPSCSSGYESAAPLAVADVHIQRVSDDDDDDEETNSTSRSRAHSSSCLFDVSSIPEPNIIPSSTTESNIKQVTSDDDTSNSPVISITNQKTNTSFGGRQRDRHGKFRPRSRSPTPRTVKKQRSIDESVPSISSTTTTVDETNTITSDRIELHLRTLLMSPSEPRRTRTRPVKTPTRLVEEIPNVINKTSIESDSNVFDILSSTDNTNSPKSTTNESSTSSSSNHHHHQPCTYNVTISTKPNKLGLTIKKVVQR